MLLERERGMRGAIRLGAVFCLIAFTFGFPCLAQSAPKGKMVVASGETFVMNGGDPHTAQGSGAINIFSLIHEGLVRMASDGSFIPGIAKSWKISEDGLVIEFILDEKAKFHDGTPVTAEDVKFSLERVMRPELKYNRGGNLKRAIDRVQIIDKHHVTVYLKSPFPPLFDYSTEHLAVLPKAYIEKVGDVEFAKHPIGAGPFRWVDGQQDVFVKATAVEDHYRQPPHVKTVEFRFGVDEATLMAMLRAGEADVVQLPLTTYFQVIDDTKIKIVWAKYVAGPALGFADLAFPNEPSPFHDVRVRQAVSYAINRKAICEKVLHGAAEPWGDIYAPYNIGVNPDLMADPYEPEKAKALLREAGYPDGFETTVTIGHPAGDKIHLLAIASDLNKIGIKTKLIELEGGTYINYTREKKIHGIFRLGAPWWVGRHHPATAVESAISSRTFWTYYSSPEQDAAWDKLLALSDEKAVHAQARELSRIWQEQRIKFTLWALHQPFGVSERVKSYKPTAGVMQIAGLEYLELK